MEILNARPEISQFVQRVTDNNNIPHYKITNVQTNAKGEGYLGEIFMITITDETTHKTFDIIVKAAFQSEKIRESAPIRLSFENEIYFYSTVAPLYQQLETDSNTTAPPLTAKCFLASLTDQTEMLALENLKVSGFEIFDKTLILDDEHVRLIFKNYGRFHAYSFALRDQQPEKYEETVQQLHDLYGEFLKNDFFQTHLSNIMDTIRKNLVSGEDDRVIERFEQYFGEKVVEKFTESVTSKCDYPAILHGDCWSNNMLFKYKEDSNGKKSLTDMRLIDFQIMKVGSPVCDLSYCLYSGASRKEFDKLDEYLQIYHDSFSAFLKQLGSDPEKLFPLSALKTEWKLYAKFGMLMGINIVKMKLTEKGDIMDLTDFADITNEQEMAEAFNKIKFNEVEYLQRSRDILEHLTEIDAL